MTAEDRRDLARRIGAARRRLADADHLVAVGGAGSRCRWRSTLPAEEIGRLERRAAAALADDDAAAAHQAVVAFERFAASLSRGGRGNRLAESAPGTAPRIQPRGRR